MAVDEAILAGVAEDFSPPTLRFYSFSPPAVTIGRFQRFTEELRERAESLDLDVVRRPTGGRAVVHGNDLAYSVTASVHDPVFGGTMRETYRRISERLANAFSMLGMEVSYQPGSRHQKYQASASCFDTSVLHELRMGGEKIAGSAQTRHSGAFLQQGTIALTRPQVDHSFLFGDHTRTPSGVHSLCGRRVAYVELADALCTAFGAGADFEDLNPVEKRRVEALVTKYASADWTQFGKSLCAVGSYEVT
jgi:lipoate-protein ligase A